MKNHREVYQALLDGKTLIRTDGATIKLTGDTLTATGGIQPLNPELLSVKKVVIDNVDWSMDEKINVRTLIPKVDADTLDILHSLAGRRNTRITIEDIP